MNRSILSFAKRSLLVSATVFLLTVVVLTTHPSINPSVRTSMAASGDQSWNPLVNCAPSIVTVEQVLGNATSALGGAAENGSLFAPGITSSYGTSNAESWLTGSSIAPPGWVPPGPSCTITNARGQVVSAFVQINGVQRDYRSDQNWNTTFKSINGGTSYKTGRQSDTTFNIFAPGTGPCNSSNTTGCMHTLSVSMDHDWKAAGYCGPNTACDNNTLVAETAAYKSLIDVQGFVSWNPTSSNSSSHNFSGWELHPLTAWRISNTSSDFTLSANPNPLPIVVGRSGSTTISVNTFNLFTGNISLTASTSAAPNASGPLPTTRLSPSMLFIASGGAGNTNLTITTTPSTAGNYTIAVSGSNGTLVRTVHVGIYVTDFGLYANPASISVSMDSSAQSTLTLASLNGFSGNVSLTAQVNSSSTTAGISPAQPTSSLNNSSVSLTSKSSAQVILTVTTSILTLPGTYVVSVTVSGEGVSHTILITVTVTVAGLAVGGLV